MPPSSRPVVRRLALADLAVVALAANHLMSSAGAALAAVPTVYASPSGTGTACSAAQPCSLSAAQAQVRSLSASMQADVVVQLADGTYRQSAPPSR